MGYVHPLGIISISLSFILSFCSVFELVVEVIKSSLYFFWHIKESNHSNQIQFLKGLS
jgi:hypothetical protein